MIDVEGYNSLPGAEARRALGTVPSGLRATYISIPPDLLKNVSSSATISFYPRRPPLP